MKDKYNMSLEDNIFFAKRKLVDNIYKSANLEGIAVTFADIYAFMNNVNTGNISVDDFHRTVKPRILKDAPKNLGKNPDILLNRKNVVGLQSRINKNSYNTGKRLEDFIDGLRK